MSAPLPPALAATFEVIAEGIVDLYATRYFTFACITVLLYDHVLLFPEEVQLFWRAKWNYVKILFLFNRYFVPLVFIAVCIEMSGITGITFGSEFCKVWVTFDAFLAILSLGTSQVFIILRVYTLWDNKKSVLKVLFAALLITYPSTVIVMVKAATQYIPQTAYSPLFNSCIISFKPEIIAIVWAGPIVFDITVFFFTVWNAIDRPRGMSTTITNSLYRDGVIFFLMLTSLRVFNIVVIVVAPLPLIQLGLYSLWALMLVTVHRLILTHPVVYGSEYPDEMQSINSDSTESEYEMSPYYHSYPKNHTDW